jgi:hypothetical protein
MNKKWTSNQKYIINDLIKEIIKEYYTLNIPKETPTPHQAR